MPCPVVAAETPHLEVRPQVTVVVFRRPEVALENAVGPTVGPTDLVLVGRGEVRLVGVATATPTPLAPLDLVLKAIAGVAKPHRRPVGLL